MDFLFFFLVETGNIRYQQKQQQALAALKEPDFYQGELLFVLSIIIRHKKYCLAWAGEAFWRTFGSLGRRLKRVLTLRVTIYALKAGHKKLNIRGAR